MPRTRIKICGITHPDDARLASDAGADAIGMIFHPPARRCIQIDLARQIVRAAGPFLTPVGVFVDAPPDRIAQTASAVGLALIQLHGHESPEYAEDLARRGLRILKAIRVDDSFQAQIALWKDFSAATGLLAGIVLETGATPHSGGAGVPNDWPAIRRYRDAGLFAGLPPIIAAGGLDPTTVAAVVRDLHPWAVDVSTGVESTPLRKDPAKLKAFISAATSTAD